MIDELSNSGVYKLCFRTALCMNSRFDDDGDVIRCVKINVMETFRNVWTRCSSSADKPRDAYGVADAQRTYPSPCVTTPHVVDPG